MRIDFPLKKNLLLGAIAILLVADGLLALYAERLSAESPQQELAAEKNEMKLLRADVNRALAIQKNMPVIKADCERFETSLLRGGSGYSGVSGELTEIARNSGLQISSLGFNSKEIPGKNLVEIALEATVSGDYKGVVQFLNGLQRSKNYYIIDGLTLASGASGDAPGTIRVALHLRSYFSNAP